MPSTGSTSYGASGFLPASNIRSMNSDKESHWRGDIVNADFLEDGKFYKLFPVGVILSRSKYAAFPQDVCDNGAAFEDFKTQIWDRHMARLSFTRV